MNDAHVNVLLSDAWRTGESGRRLRDALDVAEQVEVAAKSFACAVASWLRDRENAPLDGYADSKDDNDVAQLLHDAAVGVITASALIHEAHARVRR